MKEAERMRLEDQRRDILLGYTGMNSRQQDHFDNLLNCIDEELKQLNSCDYSTATS